ncbi:MAG: Abi family protein [Paludibacteraceae bacterium]|nr:Abi family protein [Paludibacteraceae bacterium]
MQKIPYTKQATSFDEQIHLLRSRGVVIKDEKKAKEYLSDIGYYRLGFYMHPFEKTYPAVDSRRCHIVKEGTTIEDIVALYYFDFDLRLILDRYLLRIEVAIRTTMVYMLSNKYKGNPYWFVDPTVTKQSFISTFDTKAYNIIRQKPTIRRHHQKYLGKYAPAWKTMEYMTFGNIQSLYENLVYEKDKKIISSHFGEPAIATFNSYMLAMLDLRNACAHGNVVFGIGLKKGVRAGRACLDFTNHKNTSFFAAIKATEYVLEHISLNRANDLRQELSDKASELYKKVPMLRALVEEKTGIE